MSAEAKHPPEGAILLTAAEVAHLLRCSVAMVMDLARAGEIQVMSLTRPDCKVRRGRGEYRFGRADVEAYVRSRLGYIVQAPDPGARTSTSRAAGPAPAGGKGKRRWLEC